MKTLSKYLLICTLLTACAQPGKDTSSPPAEGTKLEFTSDEKYQAGLLSQAYANWKNETDAIVWKDADSSSFSLAQAYILARHGQRDLGTSRIDVLVWLLENFKTTKNSDADSTEMLLLARTFIQKEMNL